MAGGLSNGKGVAAPVWDRLPHETPQAYAHFLRYRSMGPDERSIRKLTVSMQRAAFLSRKYRWVSRASAYDDYLLTLSAELGESRRLQHRAQLVRLGSTLLDKAESSAKALRETKQTASDVAALAKAGAAMADQAFPQPVNGNQPVSIGVAINNAPNWTQPNEAVLVQVEEKVLERNQAAPVRTVQTKGALPLPRRQSLKEAMIKAPVRRDE